MQTYNPGLALDPVKLTGVANVIAQVVDDATGGDVTVYRNGSPVSALVTGLHGYIAPFQTDDNTERVRITFGVDSLVVWSVEAIEAAASGSAAGAEADRAEAAAASAQSTSDALKADLNLTPLGGSVDLNTLTTPTKRSLTLSGEVGAPNHPAPGKRIGVTVTANDGGDVIIQDAVSLQTNERWIRALYAGVWTPWKATIWEVSTAAAGADLNGFAASTFVVVPASRPNIPTGFTAGLVETFAVSSSTLMQRATDWGGRIWVRNRDSAGVWSGWVEVGAKEAPQYGNQDADLLTRDTTIAAATAITNGPAGLKAGIIVTRAVTNSDTYLHQVAWEWSYDAAANQRVWTRRKDKAGWSVWQVVGASAAAGGASSAPGSGTKIVRVPVTAGQGPTAASSLTLPVTGSLTIPLPWNFPIVRWRLHVRNIDVRSGSAKTGTATLSNFRVGGHDGSGGVSNPQAASGSLDVTGTATAVTPWFSAPIPTGATGEAALALDWTSTGEQAMNLGTAWIGGTAEKVCPWSIVIEVETWATTPVVAAVGDSISVGVGSTRGLVESFLNVWAQPRGVVPVHGGSSGDTVAGYADMAAFKWTRWWTQDAAAPDAVLFELGINDFGGGATDQTVRDRMAALIPQITARVPALYLTEITPRTAVADTDPMEVARITHNEWRRTQPLGARQTWPTVAAISDDGATIRPDLDADGLHPNTAGHRALASALGVMTSPPVVYQNAPA